MMKKLNLYNFFKKESFFKIFIILVGFNVTIFYSTAIIPLYNYYFFSKIVDRLIAGSPILIQLYITYDFYINNKKNTFIKFIFLNMLLYTLSCSALVSYEMIFVNHYSVLDLLDKLISSQLMLESFILIATFLYMIFKKIKKVSLLWISIFYFSSFFTYSFSILILIFILNIFNPVLIYILSLVAKGELLLDDEKN